MQLIRFEDPHDYYATVAPFLYQSEARYNLILSILHSLTSGNDYQDHPPYMALVENKDQPIMLAVRTPPYGLLLTEITNEDAIRLIVEDVKQVTPTLPSVNAPKTPELETFAQSWGESSGQAWEIGMEQRIYELTEVKHPQNIPGTMRRAQSEDHERLTDWFMAFQSEALNEEVDRDKTKVAIERFITAKPDVRGLAVWEDGGQVVSMAGYTGPTTNGIRVIAVYTPPEHRRKGYASACVAALSQQLLDNGRKFCFLYTDLGNPTSNRIYQEMGYAPVCDVTQYSFK